MNQKKHLTPKQRYTIQCGCITGKLNSEIAIMIGVHPSTVSREIKRNGLGKGIYDADLAQEQAASRGASSHVNRRITPKVWAAIENCILEEHSPEQISGRMKKETGVSVSHETIYGHVAREAKAGGTLYRSLRLHRKKRRSRLPKTQDRRGSIKNRIGIENRPEIVESRTRIGDWEADTIVSRQSKAVLVTAVERCSLLTRIVLADCREASVVSKALSKRLSSIEPFVLTITGDNGKEFAEHEQIASNLDADFFFARPYHSWERGTNENTNGLIRQYFPKKTDFSKVTAKEVQEAEWKLNNRPRKSLGYKTASEIFKEQTGQCLYKSRCFGKTPKELYQKIYIALAA
jgi:IS30 family transposase